MTFAAYPVLRCDACNEDRPHRVGRIRARCLSCGTRRRIGELVMAVVVGAAPEPTNHSLNGEMT